MAKKKQAKKAKASRPPELQTWRVERPNSTETVTAHRVDAWDGTLSFYMVSSDDTESVSVRAFAPGQWSEYTRVEPEPPATDAP